ncbi:mechanosensitive ion channel family protein [Microbacterium sp. KUDC0406]|uniref:mechanosensitive ion channel family protein n=1 Tax=Microbacterium sp. KUDC0406 TaxID=2909588 RepID=UPI001F162F98|nr:mechanosensitive ion channel domain-containing protein [Microbacterium sp. KUDC0406]UJP11135.1 mechanosensitive ion channel family protein [Microbacterium sp. KUDC0406]
MSLLTLFAAAAADKPTFWEQALAILKTVGWKLLNIAIIIAVCIVIAFVLRLVIRRVVHRIVDNAKNKADVADTVALERSPLADMRLVQRTRTLGTILQNIVNVVLVIVALVLIVSVISPDILGSLTLLTAAVGAGLGFGAQNIVKDVLNGMFIVAEDQIGIGDVVDLGLASGVVEYVSVRITQVRDVNGTLWYVRNGEVTRIGNMSQGWARAIIDLGLPAQSDLDEVEQLMLETAQALAKDPKWRTRIIEKPEIWGLESIDGDALVVRVVIKTRANAMDDVAQELRARLKKAFDEKEIAVPTLAAVIPVGPEGARRVRGANPPKTRPTPVTGVPTIERGIWRRKKTGGSSNGGGTEGGKK